MGTVPTIEDVRAWQRTIPTDEPAESDGTLEWSSTTIVVVEIDAGGRTGIGYTYGIPATVAIVRDQLADLVRGAGVHDVRACWSRMVASVRNAGRPGAVAGAISAVDTAMWDLRARCLDLPLARLLGPHRDAVPVYGSGGFTSYTVDQVVDQFSRWIGSGCGAVKMKVGRVPRDDLHRVAAVRQAIGEDVELMVDANGAYHRALATDIGATFADLGVTWFEEPVSSDDLGGLHHVREHLPGRIEVAAGEYGYDPWYFSRMLAADAVDVLQADATRCLGYTGFLAAAELCHAGHVDLSAHCAPQLHAHVAAAAPSFRHVEWFHDHERIEAMVFDGVLEIRDGALHPDLDRPGNGLTIRDGPG